MENASAFGERLTELMVINNIDTAHLAAAVGVHATTVQRWRRGTKYLFLSQLVKLADYFDCSLDFLTGRTDTVLDYSPKPCPPFYARFREVMAERGITRYRMSKETKIKDSYFTEWSKGTDPHLFSLIEVADYLNVSVDYLVGREQ
ncbi:MAG: helix-turn-helix domain-containing protein [Firmicutes bacterium]|jgi:putative DNA-binding protein|nr:helix-turn-helix domain-containing protein [Bacillota bacterium]